MPPLKGEELAALEKEVDSWKVIEEHHITKTFKFSNFREALKFANSVGELAEEKGHHPDIFLAWGKVAITTWTHKINGLTESDFILARKDRPALQILNSAPSDCPLLVLSCLLCLGGSGRRVKDKTRLEPWLNKK